MGLLELFNKWVVEHGSAVAQEKHIALFRDQLALTDKRLGQCESEKVEIAANLEKSEAANEQLTKDNEILRSKINEYEKATNQLPAGPRTKRSNFM